MLRKSPVIRYLDAVVRTMVADSRHLEPLRMSGTGDDAGHLVAVVAAAAGHRVIVAVVAAAEPSAGSRRRDSRAEGLLHHIMQRAQHMADISGASWSGVVADALGQAGKYVSAIGGDVRYQFEQGLPAEVVQVRWLAARALVPGAQEAEVQELFWSIIGPDFGAQPGTAAERGSRMLDALAERKLLGRTLEELREGAVVVEDRIELMGLAAASEQDPWRQIVAGPSFMAYPTRSRSDPQMHYGDEYQLRLTETLETSGPWLPRPILDAAARAQTMRLLLILESTQLEDRYRLLGVRPEDITNFANDLYRTSIGLLDGGDVPSRMTPGQINALTSRMTTAVYDMLGVAAQNPVVDVADHVICGSGSVVLLEEVEASLTEPSERPAHAAFALALAVHMWIASPFRLAIASLE